MWKTMLKTNQLEVHMEETSRLVEMRLANAEPEDTASVQINHAEMIQLLHILLEINRAFVGETPYYADPASDRCS